ncbi:MAG: tetratricopeptide repeat protein [Alphaproteobacteria bacterium]|nr:tetratricopeptide repeat protein [Alphaproteobacteria bacterium]
MVLSACTELGLDGAGQPSLSEETVDPVREALASNVSLEDANAALENKDYDTAYDLLRQYLVFNPSDDAAKISLARTYLGRNEGRNAQTILDSLSKDARESAEISMIRGLALLIIGERAEASEHLELSLAEDPTLWRSANGLGLIHDFDQQWNEAEANYKRALEAKSDAAVVHNNMGYSYLLQGRVDEAVTAFATSLRHEPDLAIAQTNLRLALAARGQYTDAIAGTNRALLPQVLNNIGYVAMSRGDFESADIFFNRAIDESPVYYDKAQENLERLHTLVGEPVEERRLQRIGN